MKKLVSLIPAMLLLGCSTTWTPKHKITLERVGSSKLERELISNAEKQKIRLKDLPHGFVQRHKENGTSIIDRWWVSEFDGTKIAYTVTSEAIAYYKNRSRKYSAKRYGVNEIRMSSSSLDYKASISYHKVFASDDETLENVYVVKLQLGWHQYCGPICSMGFSRTRFVIYDKNGNLVEIIEELEAQDEDDIFYLVSEVSNQSLEATGAKTPVASARDSLKNR